MRNKEKENYFLKIMFNFILDLNTHILISGLAQLTFKIIICYLKRFDCVRMFYIYSYVAMDTFF